MARIRGGHSGSRHGVRFVNASHGNEFVVTRDGPNPMVPSDYEREVWGLETLTTRQLMQIAKREHAGGARKYGRGARKRLIEAIARKRTGGAQK